MHYTKVKAHRQKPLLPEVKEKLDRSLTETNGLTERELHCPYCGWYINTLCIKGHCRYSRQIASLT